MRVLLVYEILDSLSVEAAVYMLVERRQTNIVQRHVTQGTYHLCFLVVYTSRWSLKAIKCNIIITARKRSLGQGKCFHRCLSVTEGVCRCVQGGCLPLDPGVHPPRAHTLLGHTSPCPHGQQADGTHATGMLSCLERYISFIIF